MYSGIAMESAKVSSICSECGAPLSFEPGATQVKCSHCFSGLALGQNSRLISLNCPICSGNFYYLDGEMTGNCPYCSASLLALTQERLLRYAIPPQVEAPEDATNAELHWIPFWFLSALHYGWDFGDHISYESDPNPMPQEKAEESVPTVIRKETGPQKIFRGRVVERWLTDPYARSLGISSLRLRASIHPMEPMTSEHEAMGKLLPLSLTITQAKEELFKYAMDHGRARDGINRLDAQRSDLVAERISVLYYPFWVSKDQEFWDAVNGEKEILNTPTPQPEQSPPTLFDELVVVEKRCHSCHEPLSASARGAIFPCHKCNTFWISSKDGLESFSASYAAPIYSAGSDPMRWLPFWRVKCEINYCGHQATQVKDLFSMLNVMRPPKTVATEDPNAPLSYYVPAYGAFKAPRLDFAARDLTRIQPKLMRGKFTNGDDFSAYYRPQDAAALAYVVWIQLIGGAVAKKMSSLRVQTKAIDLWYVPFSDQGRELTNLLTARRYDRSVFRGIAH